MAKAQAQAEVYQRRSAPAPVVPQPPTQARAPAPPPPKPEPRVEKQPQPTAPAGAKKDEKYIPPPPKKRPWPAQTRFVPAETETVDQPFQYPVPDDFPFETLSHPLVSKEIELWRNFAMCYVTGSRARFDSDEELVARTEVFADHMMESLRRRRFRGKYNI